MIKKASNDLAGFFDHTAKYVYKKIKTIFYLFEFFTFLYLSTLNFVLYILS